MPESVLVDVASLPLPYDWIIYQTGGVVYAYNCATGNIDASNADIAVVLNTVASTLSLTKVAFISSGHYAPTAALNLHLLTLVGGGGFNQPTLIDYSINNPSLATAITETSDIFGISFVFANGQNYGIQMQGQSLYQYVWASGAVTASILISTNGVSMQNVAVDYLEISSSLNSVTFLPQVFPIVTLDSGASNNYIFGENFTIEDNSGEVNVIINYLKAGVLSAPSSPSTSPVVNTLGTKVEVIISIGPTATTITKNATSVFTSDGTATVMATVTLNQGESITFSQTDNVSWTWFGL